MSLSWDGVEGATFYTVNFRVGSSSTWNVLGTPSESVLVHTGLTNGTVYWYSVSAGNAAGSSSNTDQVSATPSGVVPAVPTGVSAVAGNGTVLVSWTASAGAVRHDVRWGTTSGGPYLLAQNITMPATQYQVPGLTNGTPYYFVVSAVNAVGSSANSGQVSATPTAGAVTMAVYFGRNVNGHLVNAGEVTALSTRDDTNRMGDYDCGEANPSSFCFLCWPVAFGGASAIQYNHGLAASMAQPGSGTPFGTTEVNGIWTESVSVGGEPYYIYRSSLKIFGDSEFTVI